jgi:hypothetical protein
MKQETSLKQVAVLVPISCWRWRWHFLRKVDYLPKECSVISQKIYSSSCEILFVLHNRKHSIRHWFISFNSQTPFFRCKKKKQMGTPENIFIPIFSQFIFPEKLQRLPLLPIQLFFLVAHLFGYTCRWSTSGVSIYFMLQRAVNLLLNISRDVLVFSVWAELRVSS